MAFQACSWVPLLVKLWTLAVCLKKNWFTWAWLLRAFRETSIRLLSQLGACPDLGFHSGIPQRECQKEKIILPFLLRYRRVASGMMTDDIAWHILSSVIEALSKVWPPIVITNRRALTCGARYVLAEWKSEIDWLLTVVPGTAVCNSSTPSERLTLWLP